MYTNGLNTVLKGFEIWKTSGTNKFRNTYMYISYSNSFYSYRFISILLPKFEFFEFYAGSKMLSPVLIINTG